MSNSIALITGASRGIGAQIARELVHAGFLVGINYNVSEREALSLCAELGGTALPLKADVSDPFQVDGMFSALEEAFGAPDTLICNAGIALQKLVTDTSDEDWRRIFAVNTDGVFNCCRRAAPFMIRQKRGCIVNISSIWGISGASMESAYSASKAAVHAFSLSLAKELGPSGIRVNCIAPGVIDTEMNAGHGSDVLAELSESTPLGRLGTPEDIARLTRFLASEDASFITGQVICADGGFSL